MSTEAILFWLFYLVLMVLSVWLLYRAKIGERTFSILIVASMIGIIVVAMRPDTFEMNIRGNTLKALRRENDRAQEFLSGLEKLRTDMLSMELKRMANSVDLSSVFCEATKAEEFDTFFFMAMLISENPRLKDELYEDLVRACEALLSRQHQMTAIHFEFSGSVTKSCSGVFSRTSKWPDEDGFRTLTSDEIKAELNELHQSIDEHPSNSLESDKNRKYRLDAVENYVKLSDYCSSISD